MGATLQPMKQQKGESKQPRGNGARANHREDVDPDHSSQPQFQQK
jgi:hypothetical protein